MACMSENKVVIKKLKSKLPPSVGKPFRLFDFQTYDQSTKQTSSSDDDSISKRRSYQDESRFVIQMFGINEQGETCCIYVQDYEPFFYLKVGDDWTQSNAQALKRDIQTKLGKFYEKSLLRCELVDYHKLYGFSGGKKHRFVRLVFTNMIALRKAKNLWFSYEAVGSKPGLPKSRFGGDTVKVEKPFIFQGVSLELYESNLPPLLRYFHIHQISPSGWVLVPVGKCIVPAKTTTTCTHEYICMASQLKPLPEKETRVPYKICSFDIEASSSHGDFPLPVKTYKRLATNIVDVFYRQRVALDNDIPKITTLIAKLIRTAFSMDKFEDVDLVYPKNIPSKETVKRCIELLISTPIQDAKHANQDEDNAHILCIDHMFEKIKEQNAQLQVTDTVDDENTGVGGGDDDNDIIDEPVQRSDDVIERAGKTFRKPAVKVEKTFTIIDVLCKDKYDRDEKIQLINETITHLFPRLKGDEVTFIGSTFMNYGEPEPYLNHCLVVGSCDDVSGATIETTDNERDLLVRWTELIQTENPDIIIGYNIFGFDYEFMFRRSQELHCESEFLALSRKMGEICVNTDRITEEQSIETSQIVLASGEYNLRYVKMTGRLQIDMYTYFRREFNLPSYKLDDVACQFINDDIKKSVCLDHDEFGQVTELYSNNLTGLGVGDYIHIEISGFTSDYYLGGHKFKVRDIIRGRSVVETVKGKEVTNTYNVIVINGHHAFEGMGKSVKWGMAKDNVSPQDIFRLSAGSSADRAIVAKYCIQDCNLVHQLMSKIDVLTGYIEMSRICSVPISFLVFRGQSIKLTSYVAKKCRENNTLMPDLEKTVGADGYEGAIVLPPKCSMYMDNPVACVDYSSLYPSSMISQNYSHDSKVWTKEYDLDGNLVKETGEKDASGNYTYDQLPGYHYIDIEFDTFKRVRKTEKAREEKVKSGKKVCRWAQLPENQKSIMPAILEELLKARKDTRAMIKTERDPFMQNILDKRQNGYKVTANSLYGQCGSAVSAFYEQDVAAATTATGRMMIIYAKRIIEEVYGDRVYETAVGGPVRCKAEYVYGDSVANYTPVYVRVNSSAFDICTIEQLAVKYGNNNWTMCSEPGKQDKEFCELTNIETWTEKGWTPLYRVIRHLLASHKKMFRILTHTGLVDVTDDHSLLTPDGSEISPKMVKVGSELLHNKLPMEMIYNFGSCPIADVYIINSPESHIDIATSLKNAQSDGLDFRFTSDDRVRICANNEKDNMSIDNINEIISIREITYEGYVYDLTTENHHFAAGIGNMIVHNTDSVFFTFNLENPTTGEKVRGKPALEMTIEIAQDVADLCTQYLKPPMALCYEKTLMPFVLLSKKRYVGMLYETDANKGKLKYMGLSLKRRDSCDYLKDTYGGILNILMKENNVQSAITFLNTSLQNLIDGNVSMDKLMLTKALRGYYKNPSAIAHAVLAERIGKRDPGNKPKPGDRMKFLFVVNSDKKALQGEKIETPEYIAEKKLQIDYNYYITNQLMKPLQQLFGLAVEQIWEHQNKKSALNTFRRDVAKLQSEFPDLEIFMKKKEKLCSAKVKVLLFDKFLEKIHNKQNQIQQITGFFTSVK